MKILIAVLAALSLFGQTPITDTVYAPTGGYFSGRIVITAPNQLTWEGRTYVGWQKTVRVNQNGAFNESLVPNESSEPAGTSYRVQYVPTQGDTWVEYWVVPASSDPLKIADIRLLLPPDPVLTINPSRIEPGPIGYCLVSGQSGTGWEPCKGGDQSIFVIPISEVTSLSVSASQHGLIRDFLVQVYDENGGAVEAGAIIYDSSGGVSISFAVPQTGNIVLKSLSANHLTAFSSELTVSIPAESHLIRSVTAVSCRDSTGEVVQTGEVDFAPAALSLGGVVGQSADISISFAVPQSGTCTVFGV